MERKIGEIFEYNGEWYQCVECDSCGECSLRTTECRNGTKSDIADEIFGECSKVRRPDNKHAIFKKLKKVGGPCKSLGLAIQNGVIVELYKTYSKPILPPNVGCILNDYLIAIEIKNKEDMKEKKPTYEELLHYYHSTVGLWAVDRSPQEVSLDWICDNAFQLGIDEKHSNSENGKKNLKPFDLQAAKSGKPVCTRDGKKARIICFDTKGDMCPIIALVEENGIETTYHYDENGQNAYSKSELDLMMLSEKKEGWVNVYYNRIDGITFSKHPYPSKEEAIKNVGTMSNRIDTVKISWEE